MTKNEFLKALAKKLEGIPEADLTRSLDFYGEMIDDRMEEGYTEGEAVLAIGSPAQAAECVLQELPLSKLVRARIQPHRRLRTWEIVLLALGSPVWLPLLLAAAVVMLAVYVVLWSVAVALYAVEVALAACSLLGIVYPIVFLALGNAPAALAMLGAGLILAGISIFGFYGCKGVTLGFAWSSKKLFLGCKRCLIRKGEQV